MQIAANVHEVEIEGPVIGLAGCHVTEKSKNAGTSSWPSWISHFTGSFVGHSPSEMLCPPALNMTRKKFYIYSDVPHTHTLQLFLIKCVAVCNSGLALLLALEKATPWERNGLQETQGVAAGSGKWEA